MGTPDTTGPRSTSLGIAERTAALLVVVLLVVVAQGLWLVRTESRLAQEQLEERAVTLAEAIELSLADAMLENRRDDVGSIVAAVGRTRGVEAIAVADSSGLVRFSAGDAQARLPFEAGVSWTDSRVEVLRTIENAPRCQECHQGSVNGVLQVTMDATPVQKATRGLVNRLLGGLALTLLLASAAMWLVLRVAVSRPLNRLRDFALEIRRGDLGARPPRAKAPEIAALGEALTAMAEQIQQSHGELEDRVQLRTEELARALARAREAETERSTALQRLQAIIDSMADGVIFVDAEEKIALVNQRARVLRNLSDGPGLDIRQCHPEETEPMLSRVLRWLREGDDTGPPHSIIKEKEGRYETTYAPVRSAEDEFLGIVMVIRDISTRRTLERRLLDAERLAAVGQMSSQVAHELRNPLNTINGAVQYLVKILPDHPDVVEFTGLISDEVRRVNRFIEDLLNVARPAEPRFEPTDVNELVRQAVARAALARSLEAGAIALDLGVGLPSLDLDPSLILECLINLLNNSLDAAGSRAELRTSFQTSRGAGALVIEVLDRGPGIAEEIADDVGRPFVTTKADGTGLGLVIVRRAMEQHRGTFELEPREGGGTVARMVLPLRSAAK